MLAGTAFAQKIQDESIEYTYLKLPLSPLPPTIKNYRSSVFAAYEEENKKKQAQYDQDKKAADTQYEIEKAAYPASVKAAEDTYKAEMEEWKKKNPGEKVFEQKVLGENNKPVKRIPSPPSPPNVPLPNLQTSYDYPVLASTYLVLDGFTNIPENSINIEVVMYGFDYTEPRQLYESKTTTSYANGQTQTSPTMYYHNEFSYRHTMSVKVTLPDGKELMNSSPQQLNNYKIYKTPESTTAVPLNTESLIKSNEAKILNDNLTFINNMINDQIGYKRVLRQTSLGFIKSKDDLYQDLLVAFNDASSGLKILLDDEASASEKINGAISSWNKALTESNLKDKKARIDKDVTIMIHFNLLECYFALRNPEEAKKVIASLNTMNLTSQERKKKDDYEAQFNDLKKRIAINKL